MRFVASLTRGANELNTIARLWQESGDTRNPFEHVLITPLFIPKSGMAVIRSWKESGVIKNLYFDSGGFYVQMGRIDYVDLYFRLLQYYRCEQWADWYVLPDHVPLTGEVQTRVWQKVRDTVEYSRNFLEELPDDLKPRAIPVVHGHTHDQISYCLEHHLSLNTSYVGFGSFHTSGKKSSVNKLSGETYKTLSYIATTLVRKGVRLHGFGVGTPPVVYLLSAISVFSFDSIGWMKTAGFGKVFLPYIRAYNITYFDKSATTIRERQFIEMKEATGHDCYFCRSFDRLHRERYYRTLHNLAVILDMVGDNLDPIRARETIRKYSPDYTYLVGRNEQNL